MRGQRTISYLCAVAVVTGADLRFGVPFLADVHAAPIFVLSYRSRFLVTQSLNARVSLALLLKGLGALISLDRL